MFDERSFFVLIDDLSHIFERTKHSFGFDVCEEKFIASLQTIFNLRHEYNKILKKKISQEAIIQNLADQIKWLHEDNSRLKNINKQNNNEVTNV